MLAVLCRPQGYSWLDANGVYTEDKREVNPGFSNNDEDGTTGNGHADDWQGRQ